MARPVRIEYQNAYYHVMNRGRGRKRIFHDKSYFMAFLQTLSEAAECFGLQIRAYCLMGNHYHLLVKTSRENLQRAMRHIGVYASAIIVGVTAAINAVKQEMGINMELKHDLNSVINRLDP